MSIYKLYFDFENYLSFNVDVVALAKTMPGFRPRRSGISLLDQWKTPEASYYSSENYNKNVAVQPDLALWGPGYLILNQKAFDVLSRKLDQSGELLPIKVGDSTVYLFNTIFILPDVAVDKRSAVEMIDLGVHVGSLQASIDETKLDQHIIFKTDLDKKVGLYCTDAFVEICDEARLSGLKFEEY